MSPAAALLLGAAAKATLLLALAFAVERTVLRRRGSAAARHLLWTFALAGVLLLPLLGAVLPGWRVPLVAAGSPALPIDRATPAPAADRLRMQAVETAPTAATETSIARAPGVAPEPSGISTMNPESTDGMGIAAAAASLPWAELLLAAWLAGALLLLAKVAAEQLLVRRLERAAAPVRDEDWSALLRSLAAGLGVRRPVALLRSAGPTMPMTWGFVRPAVLLPADADAWPASRRYAVLVHELAHVARHDCLTQTLAAVACALYWPHPGVWWAARRLRVERELACDDQALSRGIGPRDYAGHLLELARGLRAPRALASAAVSMAARSHLETRLLAVIDGARVRTAPGRRATMIGAALTALLLLPLSAMRASAAEEETDRASATAAERTAASARGRSGAADPAAPSMSTDTTAVPADARQPFGGRWSLSLAGPLDAPEAEGRRPLVHVTMHTPGLNTFYAPLGEFEGLTRERIASTGEASFRLRRDAGTFTFEGSFRDGQGTGRFGFTPDPAFAKALARRGMERPTAAQQFSLARHGMPLAYLDELAAHGYARPTTEAYERAGLSGADRRYVREMAGLGYRLGTLEALVRVYNVGVDPRYIRELAGAGVRGLTTAELSRMRSSGVDAEFVRRARAAAGRALSVDELVSMRGAMIPPEAQTTTPVMILPPAPTPIPTPVLSTPALSSPTPSTPALSTPAGFTPDGTTPLTGRWIITRYRGGVTHLELRWDDDTQWRRSIELADLSGVSGGEMASPTPVPVSFRIEQDAGTFELSGSVQGGDGSGPFRFQPNRRFAATLRSLGVAGVGGGLTDHQLKNLAFGGMSAASVRELQGLGFTSLTVREVIDMAIRIVTPEYARSMQSFGIAGANTVEGIVELRFHNVTPAYVRELAALGYRGLSSSQVVELYSGGVTAAFIRSVRAGQGDPSPEALLQLWERQREREREARRGG